MQFYYSQPKQITKRDGRVVPFDAERITAAIEQCYISLDERPLVPAEKITDSVINLVSAKTEGIPTVESVQDAVENVFLSLGLYDAAKHYILYRAEHEKIREERPIPTSVIDAFDSSKVYFPTVMQEFMYLDHYSRYDYNLGRREAWVETVDRSVDYLYEVSSGRLNREVYEKIRRYILEMKAMPSMRLLAMAGPAARRNEITIYNCSYAEANSIDAFCEALLISMCGTGFGFSVESRCVEQLPRVLRQRNLKPELIIVEDSTEGWVDALRRGLQLWFDGGDAEYDFSLVRPAGAPLKVKGGRSSGPEIFDSSLKFIRSKILARQGGVVRPIDAHDIMCSIASAAVSGGVRRSAMISLFDFNDYDMLHCKDGDFEKNNSQRWNANNSAVWQKDITQREFMRQFMSMVESERGEPGIFNRSVAETTSPVRRIWSGPAGTNPCGEIFLHDQEFCNLSIAVARNNDDIHSLSEKVEIATIIGTIQSMATNFPGLRPGWKENCERERLLGVDINGQMDCPEVQIPEVMQSLKAIANATNIEYSEKLGIHRSAAITCVKPGGNSSQLLDCASGIHARWAPYYVRNIRVSSHSPLFKVMRDAGIPMDPENGQLPETADTFVIHFPVKAPDGAKTRNDRSAIEQCDYWLRNKQNWTEHNPSVTITYKPEEVLDVMKWVWDHKDLIAGMAFLPSFDAQYAQLPYIEIGQEEYERRVSEFPSVDFSKVYRYEAEDNTTAAFEIACMSGVCDIQL